MTPTDAVIDYRVHYVGPGGLRRPKVFNLTRRRLEPGRPTTVVRRHRFEHVSIRRNLPGRHLIDVQINGRILGGTEVALMAESGGCAPARGAPHPGRGRAGASVPRFLPLGEVEP